MKKTFILLCIGTALFGKQLIVSDRLDFYDPHTVSEKQHRKWININDPYTLNDISRTEWKKLLEGKRVAVLVHGFNNDYDDALKFFEPILYNVEQTYDVCICYLWPGGDSTLEYFLAKDNTEEITLPFRFLHLLLGASSYASHTDVIAHSMGCRLTLESLCTPSTLSLNNVYLMAPAVNNESIEEGEEFGAAIFSADNIYVFYSRNDEVIDMLYPVAEWDVALGASGPEHPDRINSRILPYDCTDYVANHHAYLESEYIYGIVNESSHAE